MRLSGIFVFAALTLAACSAAPPVLNETEVAVEEKLELDRVDPDALAGTYSAGGHGVVFDVRTFGPGDVDVIVRTGDGRELVRIGRQATDVLFLGRPLEATDGGMATLRAFGETPEAKLLPPLSRALGDAGVTGVNIPASLPLHRLALNLDKGGIARLPPRSSAGSLTIKARCLDCPPRPGSAGGGGGGIGFGGSASCTDIRHDPEGNECFGMCGDNCNCWSWVCGDCCKHAGCAAHDRACASCHDGDIFACPRCYGGAALVALNCSVID